MNTSIIRRAVLALGIAILPAAGFGCGVCSCALNSDWASQGLVVGSGLRLDLRHDDYTQDRILSGSNEVSASALARPNAEEVQRTTHNRVTTLGIDYSPTPQWGINLQLPWVDRFHDTWDEGETELSASHTRGIGDARIGVRYQQADASHGLQAGLKLPTGDSDAKFRDGPVAGEEIDRGLQPGTGTVDLLLGAFRYGNFSSRAGWFLQAQAQLPLGAHEGFRPGDSFSTTAGLRWLGGKTFAPQLQLHARIEGRESGAEADRDNSGAEQVFLSPGISARLGGGLGAYLFVQVPVYQHVNGWQLEPESMLTAGLSRRL